MGGEGELSVDRPVEELGRRFRVHRVLRLARGLHVKLLAFERYGEFEGRHRIERVDAGQAGQLCDRNSDGFALDLCFGWRGEWDGRVHQVKRDVLRNARAVAKHDKSDLAHRVEANDRAIAAGAAIVEEDASAGLCRHADPAEPDLAFRRDAETRLLGEAHGAFEIRLRLAKIGGEEFQHVVRGGAERAGAREGRQVPVPCRSALSVMALRQRDLHHRRERDTGTSHAERHEDAFLHQRLVVLPGAVGEDGAQDAHAEV